MPSGSTFQYQIDAAHFVLQEFPTELNALQAHQRWLVGPRIDPRMQEISRRISYQLGMRDQKARIDAQRKKCSRSDFV